MAKRKSRKKNLGPGAPVAVFGLVLLILGVVMSIVGTTDYTDHTERADAVVSERLVEVTYEDEEREPDERREEITVFVDYTAEGQDLERVELQGLDADDHYEGQELAVAYAPGEPGHVVTVPSTEEGAYDVFLYIGIAALVLSVPLLVTGVLLTVKHVKRRSGAGSLKG
ncbi:DUF3592 domain-containing protein [Nocardiopsis sp. RSe5-2]|uniref:DUF3592 domain-containing protein n=1 Tax=Nocardiopsis endophytica TaxID=3018445 RepID=A0ABT4U736_9ACTN|nr:DUF3592 domain-containing protein [Nocardiopsis endophytica]MDA2812767.1 DUF3592 domain-containing protein [Nocardiopsis endophytica]